MSRPLPSHRRVVASGPVPARSTRRAASSLALAAVLASGLVACSSDDDDDTVASPSSASVSSTGPTTPDPGGETTTTLAPTTTTTAPPTDVAVTLVSARATSPLGDDTDVDPAVRDAITAVAEQYVQLANVDPLYSAAPPAAAALAGLFEPAALARATGVDAAALIDTGPAPATGGVAVERADVTLTVLEGEEGAAQLATAEIHVALWASVGDTAIRVERIGALTLVPSGPGWVIDGWDLVVQRTGPGVADASASTTPMPATAAPGGATATTEGPR